jgi:hypothetical protein
MQSGSKPVDVARLKADLAAAGVELLSAQCATDRVRLQYSLPDILTYAEQSTLNRAIASAEALCRFFSQVQSQMKQKYDPQRR